MKKGIWKKILGVVAIGGALALIASAVGCTKNGNDNARVSNTNAGSTPKEGFRAELKTEPSEAEAGKPTVLIVSIKDASGAMVRDLDLAHEKPVHLIVVSSDLSEFYHIHPEPQPDGAYRVMHSFPNGGDYKLYADFTPPKAAQVIERFDLKVVGSPRSRVALAPDPTTTKTVDGLRVALTSDTPLRPGKELVLNLAVSDEKTGKPVTDLQRYLGAPAHIVIISEDTNDFLHVHPAEKGKMDSDKMEGMKGMEGMDHSKEAKATGGKDRIASEISAHTSFPRPGLYKVWAQFQRSGRVITVPFVVRVAG